MEGLRPGDGAVYILRVPLASRAPANQQSANEAGVSTPWGDGIDPTDHRLHPQCVGVAEVWKDV